MWNTQALQISIFRVGRPVDQTNEYAIWKSTVDPF